MGERALLRAEDGQVRDGGGDDDRGSRENSPLRAGRNLLGWRQGKSSTRMNHAQSAPLGASWRSRD